PRTSPRLCAAPTLWHTTTHAARPAPHPARPRSGIGVGLSAPPARGGVPPPAPRRAQRLRRRGDHARAPRAGDEPAPRLLLPARGRPPREVLHAHAPRDLLRVEGRCALLHHRGRGPCGRERGLVLPGAGPGLRDHRGPRRLLPGARGCLLRRRGAGRGTGRWLLRRLDHARRDRTVQGWAGDGGLVGSSLRPLSLDGPPFVWCHRGARELGGSRRDRWPGERHAYLRRRRPALAPGPPDAREAARSPAALSMSGPLR